MTGHRKWREIRRDVPAEARAQAERNVAEMQDRYDATLAGLRKARALTQVQLATQMDTSQAEISRIERQTDLLVSTLRRFIVAMGGRLDLVVTFDNESYTLDFGDIFVDQPSEPAAASANEAAS